MKKFSFLFMLFSIVISQLGLSQSVENISSNEETNYFEKVIQIENYISTSETAIDNTFLKRYYRWRYFLDSRVNSNGDQEENIKAWHEIHDNKEISLNEKSSGLSWEFVGPYDHQINDLDNWIGRVSCLAADPDDQNILYAGANTGGLWKTTNPLDVEPHWECLTDDYAGKPHT